MFKYPALSLLLILFLQFTAKAQLLQQKEIYTRADSLRGMLTPLRTCYDINYYHLDVAVNIDEKSIQGSNEFVFTAKQNFSKLQFDLFANLSVDKVIYKGQELPFSREFNAVFVNFPKVIKKGSKDAFTVFYSGKPIVGRRPPWDGGFIFSKDKAGKPWVSVACQGLGASCWWPNKDHQSDEVDSILISITVPQGLKEISNGRLRSVVQKNNGSTQFNWFVSNPINNYDVTFYIGDYAHWTDQFAGEKGNLSIDYWALKQDSAIARPHWDADVKPMLSCFENWFGHYPFYEDGYKLVQAPHLGMEHQSAVAYGNGFQKGYLGRDLSKTGLGMKFDFITIHESGHEWFGNSITSKDIADMWIHESFTNYSEALFTECIGNKQAGAEYVRGIRKNIRNDVPIIGPYNVNKEGSGDMYYKGANMIHLIRQLVNDDSKFRAILRGLNQKFYHKTVTTAEVEAFLSKQSGLKLSKVFDQYLRHATIPTLEYKIVGQELSYRWLSDVDGFDMPVKVSTAKDQFTLIYPTKTWKKMKISIDAASFAQDPDFYIQTKLID